MTQNNQTLVDEKHIPKGYKKTEVGVIPSDWDVKKLGDISSIYSGGTPNRKVGEYWGGLIPWVTTTLINGGEIKEAQEYITSKGYENSSAKWCEKETILMAMYGQGKTRGKVGKLVFGATINQACAAIKVDDKYNVNYILSFLNSKYEAIRDLSNAGGQENLSGNIVKSISILIPSLNEQQKIASALSDTDALISELEKLIEKKQAIKTATMQQLLTGKTRLPEFALREDSTSKGYKDSELGQIPEDWEVKKLGELVEITSGESPSKFNFVNDGIPYFKVEQLNNGNFYAESTPYSVKLGKTILAGSLIFPKRGASILSNKIRILKVNACMDTNLMALSCSHELNPNYLLYSLSYGGLDKVADTTSIPQINNKHILPYKIFYPSVSEQIAISSILVDLENEIELSQQKIEKLRKIKLGMMQELLTGKTRLV